MSRPDRLSAQYKRTTTFKAETGRDAFCYSGRIVKRPEQPEFYANGVGSAAPEPHGTPMIDQLMFGENRAPYTWGMSGSGTSFAAKHVFERYPFDENLRHSEESDQQIRAALDGLSFISAPEPLLYQYTTDTSDKSLVKTYNANLQILNKHANYFRSRGLYWPARMQLKVRHAAARKQFWLARYYVVCRQLAQHANRTKTIKPQ